ncbi:MAG: N-acetylmuramoyl-L-alanine amidase [Clostridiales bacterium]|nr:N-acetylmuramoyl-L-alanine amidase [Clostridiales bacterium]
MKKYIITIILIALFLSTLLGVTMFSFAQSDYALGDVNRDGNVSAADAALILRSLVELATLDEEQQALADVNENGVVDAADAAAILRYLVELGTIPPAKPTVTPSPSPTPTPALPLSGKTIILDPGHGRHETLADRWRGGSYDWTLETDPKYEGGTHYHEADRVLDFALEARKQLQAQGATVIMTRSGLNHVGSYSRMSRVNITAMEHMLAQTENPLPALIKEVEDYTAIMNSIIPEAGEHNGPIAQVYYNTPYSSTQTIHPTTKRIFDMTNQVENLIFISIHTNARGSGSHPPPTDVNGVETYYIHNASDAYNKNYYLGYRAAENKKLADLLLTHTATETGFAKRSSAPQDYFMIREHNVPGALIEIGYHNNWSDYLRLMDESMPDKVAKAIVKAALAYFK